MADGIVFVVDKRRVDVKRILRVGIDWTSKAARLPCAGHVDGGPVACVKISGLKTCKVASAGLGAYLNFQSPLSDW